MEVPYRYPYNPPAWLILLCFGTGILWIAVDWLPYWLGEGHGPTGFHLWRWFLGFIPIVYAFGLAVCRILFERYLLLDHDRMVVPVGLFQMRTATIDYTGISRVWRHYIGPYEYRFVLKVASGEQVLAILPSFLPDNESFCALEEFLNRKLSENARAKKTART